MFLITFTISITNTSHILLHCIPFDALCVVILYICMVRTSFIHRPSSFHCATYSSHSWTHFKGHHRLMLITPNPRQSLLMIMHSLYAGRDPYCLRSTSKHQQTIHGRRYQTIVMRAEIMAGHGRYIYIYICMLLS